MIPVRVNRIIQQKAILGTQRDKTKRSDLAQAVFQVVVFGMKKQRTGYPDFQTRLR